jgi:F-type H+-transporting ATPase subunit epsilon
MRLSVTTPRGALVDTDVEEVTAPGVLGELGVLPGHVPLMSALKPGVLVYRTKDDTGIVAVGQGFLQVAPTAPPAAATGEAPAAAHGAHDRVLVLVDHALTAASVDRAAAERELGQADSELGSWKRELDGDYQALLMRRNWAAARLDAAARATPH